MVPLQLAVLLAQTRRMSSYIGTRHWNIGSTRLDRGLDGDLALAEDTGLALVEDTVLEPVLEPVLEAGPFLADTDLTVADLAADNLGCFEGDFTRAEEGRRTEPVAGAFPATVLVCLTAGAAGAIAGRRVSVSVPIP